MSKQDVHKKVGWLNQVIHPTRLVTTGVADWTRAILVDMVYDYEQTVGKHGYLSLKKQQDPCFVKRVFEERIDELTNKLAGESALFGSPICSKHHFDDSVNSIAKKIAQQSEQTRGGLAVNEAAFTDNTAVTDQYNLSTRMETRSVDPVVEQLMIFLLSQSTYGTLYNAALSVEDERQAGKELDRSDRDRLRRNAELIGHTEDSFLKKVEWSPKDPWGSTFHFGLPFERIAESRNFEYSKRVKRSRKTDGKKQVGKPQDDEKQDDEKQDDEQQLGEQQHNASFNVRPLRGFVERNVDLMRVELEYAFQLAKNEMRASGFYREALQARGYPEGFDKITYETMPELDAMPLRFRRLVEMCRWYIAITRSFESERASENPLRSYAVAFLASVQIAALSVPAAFSRPVKSDAEAAGDTRYRNGIVDAPTMSLAQQCFESTQLAMIQRYSLNRASVEATAAKEKETANSDNLFEYDTVEPTQANVARSTAFFQKLFNQDGWADLLSLLENSARLHVPRDAVTPQIPIYRPRNGKLEPGPYNDLSYEASDRALQDAEPINGVGRLDIVDSLASHLENTADYLGYVKKKQNETRYRSVSNTLRIVLAAKARDCHDPFGLSPRALSSAQEAGRAQTAFGIAPESPRETPSSQGRVARFGQTLADASELLRHREQHDENWLALRVAAEVTRDIAEYIAEARSVVVRQDRTGASQFKKRLEIAKARTGGLPVLKDLLTALVALVGNGEPDAEKYGGLLHQIDVVGRAMALELSERAAAFDNILRESSAIEAGENSNDRKRQRTWYLDSFEHALGYHRSCGDQFGGPLVDSILGIVRQFSEARDSSSEVDRGTAAAVFPDGDLRQAFLDTCGRYVAFLFGDAADFEGESAPPPANFLARIYRRLSVWLEIYDCVVEGVTSTGLEQGGDRTPADIEPITSRPIRLEIVESEDGGVLAWKVVLAFADNKQADGNRADGAINEDSADDKPREILPSHDVQTFDHVLSRPHFKSIRKKAVRLVDDEGKPINQEVDRRREYLRETEAWSKKYTDAEGLRFETPGWFSRALRLSPYPVSASIQPGDPRGRDQVRSIISQAAKAVRSASVKLAERQAKPNRNPEAYDETQAVIDLGTLDDQSRPGSDLDRRKIVELIAYATFSESLDELSSVYHAAYAAARATINIKIEVDKHH